MGCVSQFTCSKNILTKLDIKFFTGRPSKSVQHPLISGRFSKWGIFCRTKFLIWKYLKRCVGGILIFSFNWRKVANCPSIYKSLIVMMPFCLQVSKAESERDGGKAWLKWTGANTMVFGRLQFFRICCQIFRLFRIILLFRLEFPGRPGGELEASS